MGLVNAGWEMKERSAARVKHGFAERHRSHPVSARALLRCFSGGVLMGWGSLLIPGSNDGLILIGMPLLWPYAWVAFGTMCMTIAGAQLLRQSRAVAVPKA